MATTAAPASGPGPDVHPGTERRWLRRALAALGGLLAVLSVSALVIAYAWQPSATAYASPYLARIDSRYADTLLARFHYTKTGHGSPVVLVAGGGQWLYSYRDTVPALAADHTVYAVDLPGQGYTTLKKDGFSYDLDAMAGALGTFMDAVGLRTTSVVGHSWGGSWSLYFAERYPERVDRLVLMGSTGLNVPSGWDWRPLEFPVVGEVMGKLMRKSDAARVLRKAFANPERVTDEVVAEDWAPMSRPANREALWASQRNIDYTVTQRLMGKVTAATLVLWGGEDRFDEPWQAAAMAKRIPGAASRVLPGCGHNVHEDCPAVANPVVAEFLDGA
ncbi:alpha/beta hydrolase [Nonomuraea sp. 3-1Str]|uniref:alpha/beta fold hydrolase n=1 Tax=Nonomuraea sp. 3-1Str TaxID=2929801 RepID=UPI002863CA61|nr:alpha/beta hydrolase [Nonomuraea sp. 3-1Str]MDR8407896.1 alpha/beta hydrolase [Nonomuraea sp. 3-1Str]